MLRRGAVRAILAVALSVQPVAWSAELVVIESTAGNYEGGDLVKDGNPIILGRGEELTLLAEDGTLYRHRGPYEGSPVVPENTREESIVGALADLVGSGKRDTSAVGATRSIAPEVLQEAASALESPPWRLIATGGVQCVVAGEPAKFWRSDSTAETSLVIKQVSRGSPQEVAWLAGQPEIDWPAAVPRQDGGLYLVRVGASPRSRHLTLHEIPAQVAKGAHGVAWLAAKDCDRQARTLFAAIEDGSDGDR